MSEQRQRLVRQLAEYAYQFDPVNQFRLASGQLSDEYLDCKRALGLATTMQVLGDVVLSVIPDDVVAIGGLTMGADPIAMSTSQASAAAGRNINWFCVRKEAKGYGRKKSIEGYVNQGDRVVVVDDVVTTGGSTITAIHRCIEAGLSVRAVVVLVDREQSDGMEAIRKAAGDGVCVTAIFTKSEIKAEWLKLQAERT